MTGAADTHLSPATGTGSLEQARGTSHLTGGTFNGSGWTGTSWSGTIWSDACGRTHVVGRMWSAGLYN